MKRCCRVCLSLMRVSGGWRKLPKDVGWAHKRCLRAIRCGERDHIAGDAVLPLDYYLWNVRRPRAAKDMTRVSSENIALSINDLAQAVGITVGPVRFTPWKETPGGRDYVMQGIAERTGRRRLGR